MNDDGRFLQVIKLFADVYQLYVAITIYGKIREVNNLQVKRYSSAKSKRTEHLVRIIEGFDDF